VRFDLVEIIKYPHPTLRYQSKPLKRIDSALRETVAEMFQLMYEAQGIGLAANQVDLPYRLFVLNVHEERLKDHEMVFINPVISRPKDPDEKEEGCLSLPGVYAQVRRPASIHVTALNLAGEPIEGEFGGLLARAIQHETDHLDGILFIDRLVDLTKKQLQDDLDRFQKKYDLNRTENNIPSDEIIFKRLAEMEATYCV
tara:strand:+ start:236 stop:832 length:597 start_codon:yes stop_codon:yes gene_type:complete